MYHDDVNHTDVIMLCCRAHNTAEIMGELYGRKKLRVGPMARVSHTSQHDDVTLAIRANSMVFLPYNSWGGVSPDNQLVLGG